MNEQKSFLIDIYSGIIVLAYDAGVSTRLGSSIIEWN